MEAAYRSFNAVLKALAQVAPDRVIAGGNDTTLVTSISHLNAGKYRVYLEVYGGGYGASPRQDGCDAVDSPALELHEHARRGDGHGFRAFPASSATGSSRILAGMAGIAAGSASSAASRC